MSDLPQGEGWRLAPDGKWYAPDAEAPPLPTTITSAAPSTPPAPPPAPPFGPDPGELGANPSPAPPKPRTSVVLVGTAILGAALIVFGVVGAVLAAGRSTPTKHPKAASTTLSSRSDPSTTSAAAGSSGGSTSTRPSAASTSSGSSGGSASSTSGGIGSTLTAKDQNGQPITITLVKVFDPGTPASGDDKPDSGQRLVAVQLKMANPGGTAISEAADNDAKLIDSKGQSYQVEYSNVKGCENYPGPVALSPGQSKDGCVVFALPAKSTVARLEFTPSSGFSNSTAQWKIS